MTSSLDSLNERLRQRLTLTADFNYSNGTDLSKLVKSIADSSGKLHELLIDNRVNDSLLS